MAHKVEIGTLRLIVNDCTMCRALIIGKHDIIVYVIFNLLDFDTKQAHFIYAYGLIIRANFFFTHDFLSSFLIIRGFTLFNFPHIGKLKTIEPKIAAAAMIYCNHFSRCTFGRG